MNSWDEDERFMMIPICIWGELQLF